VIIAKHTRKVIFCLTYIQTMSQLLPNNLGYQQKESTEICKYLKTSKQIPGEEGQKKKQGKGCQFRYWDAEGWELLFWSLLEVLARGSPGKQWHEDTLGGPALKPSSAHLNHKSKSPPRRLWCLQQPQPALARTPGRILKCSLGFSSNTTKKGQLLPLSSFPVGMRSETIFQLWFTLGWHSRLRCKSWDLDISSS